MDLNKPSGDYSRTSSSYVQLISLAKTYTRLSILRPFDHTELHSDLSKDLLSVLESQAQKAKKTEGLYLHVMSLYFKKLIIVAMTILWVV